MLNLDPKFQRIRFYYRSKLALYRAMSNGKSNFALSKDEWQIVLDSLSNTIFNEELTDEARKNAKELFLKLQKELSIT
jgi:hypothetical protein